MRLKDEPDAAALAGIMATSYCEADSQPQLAQFLVRPGGPVNPATRQIAPLSRKMLDGGLRTRNRSALLATPLGNGSHKAASAAASSPLDVSIISTVAGRKAPGGTADGSVAMPASVPA